MMDTYDPSYFVEKELFLDHLREQAVGESEQYQEFVEEMTAGFSYVLELYRECVETYDSTGRRKAWKCFLKAAHRLDAAINRANTLLRGKNEISRVAE